MNTSEAIQIVESDPTIVAKGEQAMRDLMLRASTDLDFRSKLLTDPRAALSEFSGVEIPDSVDVQFIENDADATFVLPDPIDPEAELSPEELEAVAGGVSDVTVSVLSIIASLASIIATTIDISDVAE